jgi:hypothetical protein
VDVGRFPQSRCSKGSQRWIQWFVNHAPEVLDEQIGLGPIDWRSPRDDDDYAEYRDESFLKRLDIALPRRSLESFWPRGGPQWDALGRARSGSAVLVEAKAHLNELYSPASAASEPSLAIIQQALAETAQALGVAAGYDWSKQFYQYGNRLAHAHLLDQINCVPTKLVFVYFVGDPDVRGPSDKRAWELAIHTVHRALGLQSQLTFVKDIFIDVRTHAPLH